MTTTNQETTGTFLMMSFLKQFLKSTTAAWSRSEVCGVSLQFGTAIAVWNCPHATGIQHYYCRSPRLIVARVLGRTLNTLNGGQRNIFPKAWRHGQGARWEGKRGKRPITLCKGRLILTVLTHIPPVGLQALLLNECNFWGTRVIKQWLWTGFVFRLCPLDAS